RRGSRHDHRRLPGQFVLSLPQRITFFGAAEGRPGICMPRRCGPGVLRRRTALATLAGIRAERRRGAVVVAKTKVFCIGFQKTGTTSMEKALRHFGYRVMGVFGDDMTLDEVRRTYVDTALKLAGEYDAVQDLPFPLVFRELDQAYPGSKFILTVRD